jgi:hypothetical protein
MPNDPGSPKQKYYSAGPNESEKFDKNRYPGFATSIKNN